MLSPDVRTVAVDLLRPAAGYELDLAILTTYTLDLETLLALPFAVVAHADGGVDALLDDPLLLLQGLREAGDRIHVFVDETGIAVPRRQRELYGTLEQSVHPVRADGGGVFHPKVWLVRFVSKEDETDIVLRVAILSRNLTFDRSWDVALASEASPRGRQVAASGALGRLAGDLAGLSTMRLPQELVVRLREFSAEVWRCSFPAPEGFSDAPIQFHAMGLARARRWRPKVSNGRNVLAVAPFIRAGVLDAIRDLASDGGRLVSRAEELADIPQDALSRWAEVSVLADGVQEEGEDDVSARPSGLHAKFVAVEHGWDVTWFIGSANLTPSALEGRNVEVMAEIAGRKNRVGIARFLDGFDGLCASFQPQEDEASEGPDHEADELLDQAVELLVSSGLRIRCRASGDVWVWSLEGRVSMPPGIEAHAWPVSIGENQARALALPVTVTLPKSRLSAFTAFRLATTGCAENAERRIVLKLRMAGAPPDRSADILRSLIDSPERLMAFLRALLAGLGDLGQFGDGEGDGAGGAWREAFDDDVLLEDMLRTASKDPERLGTVRRLMSDLRKTEAGRQIVPDRLLGVWSAVEAALTKHGGGSDG